MQTVLKVATVLAGVVAMAASATAPTKRRVETTAVVRTTYDQAWDAVIDLFSERNWAIQNMDRDSGLITTDWMSLGSEADTFADCGGSGIASVGETAVRFNVRVKPGETATSVAVNASFRQLRSFDGVSRTVECVSKGTVEALVHDEVDTRSARSQPRRPKTIEATAVAPLPQDPAQPRGFYCASSAATPEAGICTRAKADCARLRDAAVAAIADLGACALVEVAHCFDAGPGDERCAPAVEGCASQRERAGARNDCRETR